MRYGRSRERGCPGVRIFDFMLLIAAGALGYAGSLASWPLDEGRWRSASLSWKGVPYRGRAWSDMAALASLGWLPAIASVSIALFLARATLSGFRLRRFAAEPGSIACLMTSLAFLAILGPVFAENAIQYLTDTGLGRSFWLARSFKIRELVVIAGGTAVAAGWLLLALGGRWRPVRSWLDRCGRTIGIARIAGAAAFLAHLVDELP